MATTDEMCLAFILYYPRMDVDSCRSIPLYGNINSDYRKVETMIETADWDNKSVVHMFLAKLNTTNHAVQCQGARLHPNVSSYLYIFFHYFLIRWAAVVITTGRPRPVHSCCVIELSGLVLSLCLFDISSDLGAFVIGRSKITFFFSYLKCYVMQYITCYWHL